MGGIPTPVQQTGPVAQVPTAPAPAAPTALADAPAAPKATPETPVGSEAPKVKQGDLVGTLTTNEKHGKTTDKETSKLRVESVIGDKATKAEAEALAKQWSFKNGNQNVAIIKTAALVPNKPDPNSCACIPSPPGYHLEKRFTVARLNRPVSASQAKNIKQAGPRNSRLVEVGDARKLTAVGQPTAAKPAACPPKVQQTKPVSHPQATVAQVKAAPVVAKAAPAAHHTAPGGPPAVIGYNALMEAQLRSLWTRVNKLNRELSRLEIAPTPATPPPSTPPPAAPPSNTGKPSPVQQSSVQQFSPVQQTANASAPSPVQQFSVLQSQTATV